MTSIGRLAAVVAILAGSALALPGGVLAHALLQSSDPAAGTTIASAPPAVTLTFGEAPDPGLSSVKVLDSSGRDVGAGPAAGVGDHPEQLRVPLGPLRTGVYTVAWRTVSAVDGHTAAGSFSFGIGVAPTASAAEAGAPAPTSDSASFGATLSRFLLYAGLIGLFGAGLVGAWVRPWPPRSVATFAAAGSLVAALGSLGVIAVQALDAGAGLSAFLASGLGAGAIARLVVAAGAGAVAVAIVIRWKTARPWLWALAAGFASAGMLVDIVNGHAAAAGPTGLQIAVQWIHVVAAGAWLGGLAALLLSLRGSPSGEKAGAARRFSRIAGFALAGIAVTGVVRAVQEVGTVAALVTTDFGHVVIVKTALLLVIACLGTVNHFLNVPAAIRTLVPLRRVGRVEVTLGAAALLAAALLVNLVPPTSVVATPSQSAQPSIVASGSDLGTSVRTRLVVTPGAAGINDFALAVTDYDTGDPVPASTVTIRFDPASSASVGGSTLRLDPDGPGSFSGSGGNLSLDGIWRVTAVVAAPSGTVEVPMAVATRLPGLHVESNAVPDAPTIFTAHLDGGASLQAYLDPGHAGANELHATFFDAAGNELPVKTATYLVQPAGGDAAIVVPRQLEPGHFVADLAAPAGPLAADIAGPAPDGSVLHAHFDIAVQP